MAQRAMSCVSRSDTEWWRGRCCGCGEYRGSDVAYSSAASGPGYDAMVFSTDEAADRLAVVAVAAAAAAAAA